MDLFLSIWKLTMPVQVWKKFANWNEMFATHITTKGWVPRHIIATNQYEF